MTKNPYQYSVFTKPWKEPTPALAKRVRGLGFDGVEFPLRPGYQAEPETVKTSLPQAAKILADEGVKIFSVAGPTDEATIITCGQLNIPFIRVMVRTPPEENYWDVIDKTKKEYDLLVPLLEEHGVCIGVQNHCDYYLGNAAELMHLLKDYDPKHVAAIWDAAHEALNGSPPEMALDKG